MPDLTKAPWNEVVAWLRSDGFHIALVVVVAFAALRFSRLAIHGIIQALLDREATEGTAQELSAIEVRKRMDTLDQLGSNVIRLRTSIAESSWAVPSVASRSSSAWMIPWMADRKSVV